MCSVTFWPGVDGRYLLGMNRDEQRTRVAGLPPTRLTVGACLVVRPSEPRGGTWISLNSAGVTLALINWYAVPAPPGTGGVSRGQVVAGMADCAVPEAAGERLAVVASGPMRPFRLIGVFPDQREVIEWRWDGTELTRCHHEWSPAQWLSSGFDEPGAQRTRSAVFRASLADPDAGSRGWLRRLHGSHLPEPGPWSTCMHRPDAATVSYTEIEACPGDDVMRYHGGPPCQLRESPLTELRVRP